MKLQHFLQAAAMAMVIGFMACNNPDTKSTPEVKEPAIREETVNYSGDSITMSGFIAYDGNKEGVRPAVLILPEWWGLTDYPRKRAKQLADLGYVAFAVDLYGEGRTADNPDSAKKYSTPFYGNPAMMKARFDAALAKLKTYPQVDTTRIAAIGYCFGGAQVLNLARLGEDLKGVVSFHGNLIGVPLDKSKLKAGILVCHGGADPFVPVSEVVKFRKEMDAAGVNYTFKAYEGAVHAFTNPDATALGQKFALPIAYNAAADSSSWNDMKAFFGKIFQ